MTDMLDTDFPTRPRPKVPARRPRQLTRFELWAWSPVTSFRIGLTATYVALLYFGISALVAVPPTISKTTPDGYAGYWSLALILGSIAAAFGSIGRHKIMERIETVGSWFLTLAVGSYALIALWLAYATGDENRAALGAGIFALTIPLLVRSMWLASQLLRK